MPTTQITEFTGSVDTVAARTNSAGTPVTPDWRAEERRMAYALYSEGITVPDDSFQVVAGGGGTMNVIVGSGAAEVDHAIVRGRVAGQGNYHVRLDDVTKTIALDAAGASTRTDEIYLVVYDNAYDSQSRALPRFGVRKGDAGGAAPGPDANWDAYLLLASVAIPASAPDITTATITDERVVAEILVPVTDESITAAKLAPAVLIDAVRADGAIDVTAAGLPGSLTDRASVVFTKPAGWNTYAMIAWGSIQLTGGTGQPTVRVEIGASNGTTVPGITGYPEYQTLSAFHKVTAQSTSPVTVALAAAESGAGGTHEHSTIQYIAYRLT